jgi:hypothetical protein
MRHSSFRSVRWVFVCVGLAVLLAGRGLLAIPFVLLSGWVFSLARLWRAWHPAANAVVLSALALGVLLMGSHGFLRWLHHGLRGEREDGLRRSWRWKWTLCGYGILCCALVAICCAVLTTHQLYWISKSTDPLLTDGFRYRWQLRSIAMALQKTAEGAGWDGARTTEEFWQDSSPASGAAALETVQPVWLGQEGSGLEAILLIPRHPLQSAGARFALLQPGKDAVMRRLDELPQTLAGFGIGKGAAPPTNTSAIPP